MCFKVLGTGKKLMITLMNRIYIKTFIFSKNMLRYIEWKKTSLHNCPKQLEKSCSEKTIVATVSGYLFDPKWYWALIS